MSELDTNINGEAPYLIFRFNYVKAKLERVKKKNKGIYEEALNELDEIEVINVEEVYLKYSTLKELDI